MGFFGTFAYSGARFVGESAEASPSLVIEIHDSDIATIDFEPSGAAKGRFYLGTEPRIYFEDDAASAPVDRSAEAAAFAGWIRRVTAREVAPEAIEQLMASEDPEADPVDDFAEDTVQTLLTLAGLPLPNALTGAEPAAAPPPVPVKRKGWFRRG
ncbi:MAG: hypothetical protein JWO22_1056 [Frankiales bacterium]|nr:hypothetical protein [Frankiales bacterium]